MVTLFILLKRFCIALFLLSSGLLNAYSIVYVHIGPALPSHIPATIAQARLFNKDCPIYLIANQSAIEKASPQLNESGVTFVSCESLTPSDIHKRFQENLSHDWSLKGFWVYTSERFFYLQEFVSQYNLLDVFHFENDILLYANLENFLPVFHRYYEGMIGATFENDNRCVPGIIYISNPTPLNALIESLPTKVSMLNTDMESLARFKNKYHQVFIDFLPIVVPEYANDHSLEAFSIPSAQPELFSNHFDEFNSVFDAAALGVYLGGMDSTFHLDTNAGKIDPYCVFNPSYFSFDWKIDDEGRRVPFITYNNHEVPINNLHLTNKVKIPQFTSKLGQ